MDTAPSEYSRVIEQSRRIYELNRGLFLSERELYRRMAELMLRPLPEADQPWNLEASWPDDVKTAVLLAIARMFSDFEASQALILQGLSDQAHMPLRDSLECMMLTRLFRLYPEKSGGYLYELNMYRPAQVRDWIADRGEIPVEYWLYDFLSKRSHANLVGSAHRISETTTPGGELAGRALDFGAHANRVVTATSYALLLAVMYMALSAALPATYRLFLAHPRDWLKEVRAVASDLKDLDFSVWSPAAQPTSVDGTALQAWEKDMIDRKSGLKRLVEWLSTLEKGSSDASEIR